MSSRKRGAEISAYDLYQQSGNRQPSRPAHSTDATTLQSLNKIPPVAPASFKELLNAAGGVSELVRDKSEACDPVEVPKPVEEPNKPTAAETIVGGASTVGAAESAYSKEHKSTPEGRTLSQDDAGQTSNDQVNPMPVKEAKSTPVEEAKSTPVEEAKPTPVEEAEPTPVEGQPREEAKPDGSRTELTNIFGIPTDAKSIFGSIPSLARVTESACAEGELGGGMAVDTKVTTPATFLGEEEEEVMFTDFDCSLSVVVKVDDAWSLKKFGVGVVRVLKEKDQDRLRCVFRTRGVWKLVLNAPLSTFTMCESPRPTVAKFMAFDLAKLEEENKRSVFNVAFVSSAQRDAFLKAISR